MKIVVKLGDWLFEIKQLFARKADDFGEPYDSSAVITIVGGIPTVELLMNKEGDKFTREDFRTFKTFLNALGCEKVEYERFKDGNKVKIEVL